MAYNCVMKRHALSKIALLLPLAALLAGQSGAQSLESLKSPEDLQKLISSLDAELFDAYNRCDVEKFSSFIADGVEFYHDQSGKMVGKEKLAESLKNNICGGDVRRVLVPGSLEVHRMKGFGGVEIGIHRFEHPKSKSPVGEARFIHLWECKDGVWKITRVISFDHHTAAK